MNSGATRKALRMPESNPIQNLLSSEMKKKYAANYQQLFLAWHPEGGLVRGHKSLLGRQSYVELPAFGRGFRLWVWELVALTFPGPLARLLNYRLYVNNRKGVYLEVDPRLSAEHAWQCWQDYCGRLGFPDLPG